MGNIHTDNQDVQNRFTAYLVTSITNAKIKYGEKSGRLKSREIISQDQAELGYTDFDKEFLQYINEQFSVSHNDMKKMKELLWLLEGGRLYSAIEKLRCRERMILFSRVFGELNFADIGKEMNLTPSQAEASYYYALRKLRKELGVKKDGI